MSEYDKKPYVQKNEQDHKRYYDEVMQIEDNGFYINQKGAKITKYNHLDKNPVKIFDDSSKNIQSVISFETMSQATASSSNSNNVLKKRSHNEVSFSQFEGIAAENCFTNYKKLK